jgi:hypothetical protein
VIAKMASELAEDRRRRVGPKREAERGIESIDRLHEAEACHLHEVVERLGLPPIAERERFCQRQEAPHEILSQLGGDRVAE